MTAQHIPLADCKHGHLYRISSRNLSFGVFDSESQGFIGIRGKFHDRFLFTEYHWDTGPPFGTVRPQEELVRVPDDIEVCEGKGSVDQKTRRPVSFDKEKGWYF